MSVSQVDRAIGVMLGAAVGDALGWPQEDRSQIVGGREAREVEPRPQFRSWMRNAGTRFARYADPVDAGEYSDDTQLMLATARSCLLGDDWIQRLRDVELPQWPLYQRGGGGAVLRASRAWANGHEPWSVTTARNRDDAVKYFDAGANGVAMRIAPHAVLTMSSSVDQLLSRVVMDGLLTHGHPRALIGACVHALAIRYCLSRQSTLEYGELLQYIASDSSWRNPGLLVDAVPPGWIDSYEVAAYRGRGRGWRPEDVWVDAVREVELRLQAALDGLGRGALANDDDTLRAIGCFDKERGSGTVSAVAALYVSARTATRPISGLLRTAFLRNADTDTIASMTGSLLGAIHGPQWLNSLGTSVQDSGYIVELAASLVVERKGASHFLRSTALRPKNLHEWSELLSTSANVDALPDGRPLKVLEVRRLSTKTENFVVRFIGRTNDGQTMFLDQITKEPTEAFRRSSPYPPPETAAATLPSPPQFLKVEIRSRDVKASRDFYQNILRVACNLNDDRLDVGGFLTVVEHPEYASTTTDFILTLAVEDLDLVASGLNDRPGVEFISSRGVSAILCTDPDGHRIRILQSAGDGPSAARLEVKGQNAVPNETPWRITHRGGSMYELRNATDAPMFGVEVAGSGVVRKEKAHRIDARGGIGFLGLDVFGGDNQIDITWHRREDRSDPLQTWSTFRPPSSRS
ncbi:ADP-ribosylglycohydrolase family protein [Mycobacterium intracellulare]|uniref:ADP-ribosylglycohydrolase family protein n=1 Tax=Mycobacterium intracellulare TaxID=1767 RepID=UPI001CDA6ABE|nr:ADP-ribosylglycohydrolase family protein [Mycobacterium intracellulare]MCA2253868.1 ADP-ribosylglycohydrolase family protein [Mycobacterium intracellulare]